MDLKGSTNLAHTEEGGHCVRLQSLESFRGKEAQNTGGLDRENRARQEAGDEKTKFQRDFSIHPVIPEDANDISGQTGGFRFLNLLNRVARIPRVERKSPIMKLWAIGWQQCIECNHEAEGATCKGRTEVEAKRWIVFYQHLNKILFEKLLGFFFRDFRRGKRL